MTGWRRVLDALAGAGLFILFFCAGGAVLVYLLLGGNNSGSPELAAEWKATLAPLADPEEAMRKNPHVQGRRFANGEWVFGLCRDSHGRLHPGGGTVVVKDSRGAVRAFFGHVCGPRGLEGTLHQAKSLADYYRYLLGDCGFKEHQWP